MSGGQGLRKSIRSGALAPSLDYGQAVAFVVIRSAAFSNQTALNQSCVGVVNDLAAAGMLGLVADAFFPASSPPNNGAGSERAIRQGSIATPGMAAPAWNVDASPSFILNVSTVTTAEMGEVLSALVEHMAAIGLVTVAGVSLTVMRGPSLWRSIRSGSLLHPDNRPTFTVSNDTTKRDLLPLDSGVTLSANFLSTVLRDLGTIGFITVN